MCITNCPFSLSDGIYRPILSLEVINPHEKKSYRTHAVIDTGADECAIPAGVARILGHNLQSGHTKTVYTGNGPTTAYAHTTVLKIYYPITGEQIHTVPEALIDFLPNLSNVLLGVRSFLSSFVLNIDYPNKTFSVTSPN